MQQNVKGSYLSRVRAREGYDPLTRFRAGDANYVVESSIQGVVPVGRVRTRAYVYAREGYDPTQVSVKTSLSADHETLTWTESKGYPSRARARRGLTLPTESPKPQPGPAKTAAFRETWPFLAATGCNWPHRVVRFRRNLETQNRRSEPSTTTTYYYFLLI